MLIDVVGDKIADEEEDDEDGQEYEILVIWNLQSGPRKIVQHFDSTSTLLLP